MKRVYKYGTGEEIPEGAIYLKTVVQNKIEVDNAEGLIPCFCHNDPHCINAPKTGFMDCWLVWHYFLVEVEN